MWTLKIQNALMELEQTWYVSDVYRNEAWSGWVNMKQVIVKSALMGASSHTWGPLSPIRGSTSSNDRLMVIPSPARSKIYGRINADILGRHGILLFGEICP